MKINFKSWPPSIKLGLAIMGLIELFLIIRSYARNAMNDIIDSSYAPLLKADSVRSEKINADSLYPFISKYKLASFKSE